MPTPPPFAAVRQGDRSIRERRLQAAYILEERQQSLAALPKLDPESACGLLGGMG